MCQAEHLLTDGYETVVMYGRHQVYVELRMEGEQPILLLSFDYSFSSM
jgi:hypothetical protein